MAHHSNHPHHPAPPQKQLHKDWRLWTAVVLMLAAMAAYILSLDEAEVPGVPPQNAVQQPAAE